MTRSTAQAPLIHAIAVTYRRPQVLRDTVAAFQAQTRPPDTLLVVDNGSDLEIAAWAEDSGFRYLPMSENLGPAGAFAAGMREVLSRADLADWILLIDDDDPPPFPSAVEEVFRLAVRSPPDVAEVGLTGSRYGRRTGRLSRVTDDELEEFTDVDYVGNNQVPLIRIAAVRDVGPYDAGIFIFSEEVDFGLRLRSRGWRVAISRDTTLRTRSASGRIGLGRHAPSDRRTGGWRSYYSARNEVIVARRHGRATAPVAVTLRVLAGGVRRAFRTRSWEVLGPRALGLADGWRSRLGRTRDPEAMQP